MPHDPVGSLKINRLSQKPLLGRFSAMNGIESRPSDMLHWTIVFLILALIAGFLGFGAVAGTAAAIAKVFFFVFLVLLAVSFLSNTLRGKAP
jgi:uncharacterized membrane protein YtjA (UPF0391 family)